jgi:hypothetical protein
MTTEVVKEDLSAVRFVFALMFTLNTVSVKRQQCLRLGDGSVDQQ